MKSCMLSVWVLAVSCIAASAGFSVSSTAPRDALRLTLFRVGHSGDPASVQLRLAHDSDEAAVKELCSAATQQISPRTFFEPPPLLPPSRPPRCDQVLWRLVQECPASSNMEPACSRAERSVSWLLGKEAVAHFEQKWRERHVKGADEFPPRDPTSASQFCSSVVSGKEATEKMASCLLAMGHPAQVLSQLRGLKSPKSLLLQAVAAEQSLNVDAAGTFFKKAMYEMARTHKFDKRTARMLRFASDQLRRLEGTSEQWWVRTRTRPAMLLQTLDPQLDSDVSLVLHQTGYWDLDTLELLRHAVMTTDGLVVDVGAHVGFFGLYAAVLGADVVLFEAQPDRVKAVQSSIRANRLGDRVTMHHHIVSTQQTGKVAMQHFDIGPMGSSFARPTPDHTVSPNAVLTARVDDIVSRPVALMKVDVEGCEVDVLKSAGSLIVANYLIEVCPYLWPRCGQSSQEGRTKFSELLALGYGLHVYDGDQGVEEVLSQLDMRAIAHPGAPELQLQVWPVTNSTILGGLVSMLEKRKMCVHVAASYMYTR